MLTPLIILKLYDFDVELQSLKSQEIDNDIALQSSMVQVTINKLERDSININSELLQSCCEYLKIGER